MQRSIYTAEITRFQLVFVFMSMNLMSYTINPVVLKHEITCVLYP